MICFLQGVDDDRGRGELKISPCLNQYKIHVGNCELQGYMLFLPVHYGLAIEPLQLEVWPIIIWLVIYRVTRLEYEGFDAVGEESMNRTVKTIAAMEIM